MTGPGLSEDELLDPTVSSVYAFLFDWWGSADDLPDEVDCKAARLCLRLIRKSPTLTKAEINELRDRLWHIGLVPPMALQHAVY
jgi:hypothetical protein